MKRRITALLSLAVLFCISTSAQIFYKVEGNGLKNPSYIFGTHHLAPLSVIDEVPGCRDAYKSASRVVGEIDMTVNQMELASKIQRYMIAPADSTLSRVISREDFGRISEEFKKWAPMPGMELQMLEGMKPMVITAMVSVEMVKQKLPGYNQTEQLDTYFQLRGKATGKEVIGLETFNIVQNFCIVLSRSRNRQRHWWNFLTIRLKTWRNRRNSTMPILRRI